MTFSVDVDFWPFQAGPQQDATTRQSAGEGRGKDFAGSLFGASQHTAASESPSLTGNEHGAFSLLQFSQTLPSPSSLLLSSASPAALSPANLAESAALDVGTPVLSPDGDTDLPAADMDEAVDASLLDAVVQPGQSPVPASAAVETAIAGETAEALGTDTEVTAAVPADNEASAGDTAEEAEAALAAANSSSNAQPPLAALPLPVAGSVPVDAALKGQLDPSGMLAGAQAASKASAQAMAEPAGINRRSVPAAAEPPTHADLTAELVSNQADAALPEIVALSSDTGQSADQGMGSAQTPSPFGSAPGAALSQLASGVQASANPATPQLAPTHSVMVATATQLPDIVARATGNGQEDSIVVQLDPPELGRLSIDFKFDAQGLQHVTITAESPEAMRQLRQMHFELVQALERNGLSGQNMSFQHQNPHQNEGWGQQANFSNARFESPALSGGGLVIAADSNPHRQIASGGRLDLRL